MATKELTRCEIEEIVIKNAAKYRKYRRMLLENPKQTTEMQLNNTLPGSELSGEDLEQFAGGKGGRYLPVQRKVRRIQHPE
jgi:hypothetical protein